ncbi:MAG: glycosyltransferase family 2 protein [Acidobacteriota bacterium]
MPSPRLSIAVPVFNEEQVIPELLVRLRRVLNEVPGGPHELVFVDDGSADRTFEMLAAAAAADPRITAIALSRNFGHQIAITAALDHVSGDLVVVMDGDLQDPPEAIPVLLEQQRAGYDVVYAQRVQRKEGWLLRACYFLFYRLVARLSTIHLPIDAGDFAVLSRRVVDRLKEAPEHHRYLRGLRAWVGYRQIGIPIERARRDVGYSKYSPIRLMGLALDGVFAFSVAPLRLAAVLGVLAMCCSSLFAVYSVYVRLVAPQPTQGFTALILAMTFLAGVELLVMGIVGEYVGRIYEEVKRRPHYVIDQIARQSRG